MAEHTYIDPMNNSLQQSIWDSKYRYKDQNGNPIDATIEDTWRRVAKACASIEKEKEKWEEKFYSALQDYKFLPGGRILSNAGTSREKTTMFNCFVMGEIKDDTASIFETVKEAALTQRQGGGVGYDFSTLRPNGSWVHGVQAKASGPISFMHVFDATCRTIMSAGNRRGAQIGLLNISHPSIEDFIDAKRDGVSLKMFNLSVAITDKFIQAVEKDADWDLVFNGVPHKTVKARYLWNKIMRSTYDYAEPGVFFVDRVNKMNNLYYCEDIRAVNPCGELPLPPGSACLLGSINLTKFVIDQFSRAAHVDHKMLANTVSTAVRMLDNVIELSKYPLPQQEKQAKQKRRMGLGITGLGDVFAFLRVKYGSQESLDITSEIIKTITETAYETSTELAKEKGSFPAFDKEKYLESSFIKTLPKRIHNKIAENGIRNSHLISIAPTGTISLLAGNVSSGLEPIFATSYLRKIKTDDGGEKQEEVVDYAASEYRKKFKTEELPNYFVTTADITPAQHLAVQAILQKHVDSSISKTINVPENIPFEEFQNIYLDAYKAGLKGCTTYRPNSNVGSILSKSNKTSDEFKNTDAPKRPESLPCDIHTLQCGGEKWTVFIGKHNGKPYEIFAGLSKEIDLPIKYKNSRIVKRALKVHSSKYDLHLTMDAEDEIIIQNITHRFKNELYGSLTRLLSSCMRHGMHVKHIYEQLEKEMPEEFHSFYRGMMRVLKKYINDGEKGNGVCDACGSTDLIYQGGCKQCMQCGHSKCL